MQRPPGRREVFGFCSGIQCRCLPEVCRLVVEALIALGGDIPAEIALHAVVHEILPVLLVVVGILCVAAGHVQLNAKKGRTLSGADAPALPKGELFCIFRSAQIKLPLSGELLSEAKLRGSYKKPPGSF